MSARPVPIDHAAHRVVTVDVDASGARVSLLAPDGDTRSAFHRAVARHLRVVTSGGTWSLDPLTESVVVPPSAAVILSLDLVEIARVGREGATSSTPLTPFEVRFLADNGVVHARSRSAPVAPLRTDLHTHFAGCVTGRDLVAIGLEVGASYAASLLAEAGIRVEGAERVRLDALGEELLSRLAASFAVPIDRRVPFVDMERIYRLRAPITKHPDAFAPLCRRIAHDYAAMGAT